MRSDRFVVSEGNRGCPPGRKKTGRKRMNDMNKIQWDINENPVATGRFSKAVGQNKTYPLVAIAGQEVKYSNDRLPKIGESVVVRINGLGTGKIVNFFIEEGFLGIRVMPDAGQRPAWHIKQLAGKEFKGYTVFGAEIDFIDRTPLDAIVQKHTAFASMDEMLNAKGGYFPTIYVKDAQKKQMADEYDRLQYLRGDSRRAYRVNL